MLFHVVYGTLINFIPDYANITVSSTFIIILILKILNLYNNAKYLYQKQMMRSATRIPISI